MSSMKVCVKWTLQLQDTVFLPRKFRRNCCCFVSFSSAQAAVSSTPSVSGRSTPVSSVPEEQLPSAESVRSNREFYYDEIRSILAARNRLKHLDDVKEGDIDRFLEGVFDWGFREALLYYTAFCCISRVRDERPADKFDGRAHRCRRLRAPYRFGEGRTSRVALLFQNSVFCTKLK